MPRQASQMNPGGKSSLTIVLENTLKVKGPANHMPSRGPGQQLGMVSIKDLPQVRGGRVESNLNVNTIQSQIQHMLPPNMSEEDKRQLAGYWAANPQFLMAGLQQQAIQLRVAHQMQMQPNVHIFNRQLPPPP